MAFQLQVYYIQAREYSTSSKSSSIFGWCRQQECRPSFDLKSASCMTRRVWILQMPHPAEPGSAGPSVQAP